MGDHAPPPPFDGLRIDPAGPPGNAWGRFGPSDNLGMLNLLTPAVVRAAAAEIQTGVRVSLDWPLTKPSWPSFNRRRFSHTLVHKATPDAPHRCVNDDELAFNTQGSSQWDGFRHFGHAPAAGGQFYGGTTLQAIHADPGPLGIDAVAAAGGIVGRGVLVDYAAWADRHGAALAPFDSRRIPLADVQAAAAEQGVEFRTGDVLLLRTGFTRAYDALSDADQEALPKRDQPRFAGIEPCEATLRWLWDRQFAAVAGDAPAFETSPVRSAPTGDPPFVLHQWLLPLWGMPIGEMFDLEGLAAECARQRRWSFFLSSVPLKVPGGVASPPNAVAIF